MIPQKIGLVLFVLMSMQSMLIGQDLRLAGIEYFTQQHFEWDKELIQQEKIKSYTKYRYYNEHSELSKAIFMQEMLFDSLGNLLYQKNENDHEDKKERYFRYDSLGNLLALNIYGYSPDNLYKNIENYEWIYDANGYLVKQNRYLVINTIQHEKGGSGFPEKMFLFSSDSLFYNKASLTITIHTKGMYHYVDNGKGQLVASERPLSITELKFRTDSSLESKKVVNHSYEQNNFYDACGNELNTVKPEKLAWLSKVMQKEIACVPPSFNKLLDNLDTVTINCELYLVHSNYSILPYHHSRGTTIQASFGKTYYNFSFQAVSSEIASTYYEDSFINESLDRKPSIKKQYFEYFENGLPKKISTQDENKQILEIIEYRLEYFE